ncbi:MAG TPA: hypothetical protein VIP48_06570 [Streptosporangiaceae bacterium]
MATSTQEIQGEVLDAVRKGQELVVDAVKQWAEAVQAITPSIPVPSLPYADKLPKPDEFVASAYDFAERLLASQRTFAENMLDAAKPLLPGHTSSTTSTSSARGAGSKPAAR